MKKNVASQVIGCQMNSATDGSAFTGSVTVYVTGNAGTQAAGSVGAGACTHEGNGFHTYAPAQAETNYDHVAFTFVGTGAIPSTVQVYPSFPQTGDAFDRLGAPAGASLSADVAAVKTQTAAIEVDTQDVQSRLPAALVSGRIDASVGAMAANVMTAAAAASDLTTELQSGLATAANLATVAGYLDTEIAAILADTNELQTDWADGGRLDLILDARASQASVDTVDGIVDAILVDTAEIGAAGAGLTAIIGADGDTLKSLSDQIDGLSTASAPQLLVNTTIATLSSQTSFTLTAGSADDSAYAGAIAVITDQSTATQKAVASVSAYVGSTKTITLSADPGIFTMAVGDTIDLLAAIGSAPTAAAIRAEIDSNSTQLAAIVADTAEIGAAGAGLTALASASLLSTVAGYLDTEIAAIKAKTDNLPAAPAATGDCITAAGVRTAVGLASANLDTQLADLPTNAELATALGTADDAVLAVLGAPAGPSLAADVAAIKAQTAAIETDTAEIGAAGAGLTALASASNLAVVAGYLDTEIAAIKAKTDNLPAAPAAVGDIPSAATVAAAVGAVVVDGSTTIVQSLRLSNAALGGKASGLDTTNPKYRDLADTKNRIDATADAYGNRSAVTLDLS